MIYAIGDIHGQLDKLKAVIKQLVIKDEDLFIFLGDYIDRGELVFETIDYLIAFNKIHNCVFLRGNHEDLLDLFLRGEDKRVFKHNGGNKTIDSYYKHGYDIRAKGWGAMPRPHIDFFNKLLLYYATDDYIFVHAGIPNSKALEDLQEELMWMRGFVEHTNYTGSKTVVVGHTAFKRPVIKDNKIGIDTGACYGGYLTCIALPTKELYFG